MKAEHLRGAVPNNATFAAIVSTLHNQATHRADIVPPIREADRKGKRHEKRYCNYRGLNDVALHDVCPVDP